MALELGKEEALLGSYEPNAWAVAAANEVKVGAVPLTAAADEDEADVRAAAGLRPILVAKVGVDAHNYGEQEVMKINPREYGAMLAMESRYTASQRGTQEYRRHTKAIQKAKKSIRFF